MAKSFNSSRLFLNCSKVLGIHHKCTLLCGHGGTAPQLCSGNWGFPWVGCVVLPGGVQNHGIAAHQEYSWHRLGKVCVSHGCGSCGILGM